jgi:hypothetical protein
MKVSIEKFGFSLENSYECLKSCRFSLEIVQLCKETCGFSSEVFGITFEILKIC